MNTTADTNCSNTGMGRVLILDSNSNRVIGEDPRFAHRLTNYEAGERIPARPAFVAPVVPVQETVEDMLRNLGVL